MPIKTIYDVDSQIWKKFAILCKEEEVKMGIKISEILKKYMEAKK